MKIHLPDNWTPLFHPAKNLRSSHISKNAGTSYNKENVRVYEKHSGKKLNGMGVVIQQLIEPDFAGVIFTRSHLQAGQLLVEYVEGHGEKLVSGEMTPKEFSLFQQRIHSRKRTSCRG